MIFKKSLCALCAAAIAAFSAMPVFADAEPEFPVPEPDENGVYCHGGIVWQIMDQWDHRDELSLDALAEDCETVVGVTHKDVNITGNGEYTVEMSGYKPDYDYFLGFFGVEVDLDFDTYADVEADKGPRFEVTKCVIDGTEYTFRNDINEDGVHEQILEDCANGMDGQKIIKIKNGYGELPEGMITPEMDKKIWTTADPITVTFTVSGLPTDKIEDYADEVVEKVYGEGFSDYAAEELGGDTESPAEGDGSAVADDSETPAVSATESKAADSSKKSTTSTADDEDDDEDSNLPIILGVCGGVVVVVIIAAVIIKKKK